MNLRNSEQIWNLATYRNAKLFMGMCLLCLFLFVKCVSVIFEVVFANEVFWLVLLQHTTRASL